MEVDGDCSRADRSRLPQRWAGRGCSPELGVAPGAAPMCVRAVERDGPLLLKYQLRGLLGDEEKALCCSEGVEITPWRSHSRMWLHRFSPGCF